MGNHITAKTYNEVLDMVGKAEKYMQDEDETLAKAAALKAEEIWVKNEKYLSAFINHGLLDEVGLKLSQLEPFASIDTKEEFFASVNSAKTALIHMRSGQIPSLETVM